MRPRFLCLASYSSGRRVQGFLSRRLTAFAVLSATTGDPDAHRQDLLSSDGQAPAWVDVLPRPLPSPVVDLKRRYFPEACARSKP